MFTFQSHEFWNKVKLPVLTTIFFNYSNSNIFILFRSKVSISKCLWFRFVPCKFCLSSILCSPYFPFLCPLSPVSCLTSSAPASHVLCLLSPVLCPLSHVLCSLSHVLCLLFCPLSFVSHPMSPVLCPLPRPLCPVSYPLFSVTCVLSPNPDTCHPDTQKVGDRHFSKAL